MKVIFVLFRKDDLTHEQAVAEWSGARHVSMVKTIPGLKKWLQNYPVTVPNETAADGIGELWFESAEDMERAMSSPQMAAAVEDGKRFLDMQRTYALVVEERTMIGQEMVV